VSAPLYVRDGSRFVPLPEVLLRDVPPIPVPQPVEEGGWDGTDTYTPVPAPRCPHNHFARWAAVNCCRPER
jgi:hypothetical protein